MMNEQNVQRSKYHQEISKARRRLKEIVDNVPLHLSEMFRFFFYKLPTIFGFVVSFTFVQDDCDYLENSSENLGIVKTKL